MRNRIILTFYILIFAFAKAVCSPVDSLATNVPDKTTDIDSLVNVWYNKQVANGNDTSFIVEEFKDSANISEFEDSLYKMRLDDLPFAVPMSYNKIVRNFIYLYTKKRRDAVEEILGLSEYYFPIFEEVLDANGLPLELKYLPVIESALNPTAVSRAGATGIWQFMYHTGKMYKLEINSFVDERRDPVKSTYAAVEFFKDLYDIYGDWILVIAAYNCGPGNVNKAIRRSGGKRNYWDIYYRLPRETRGYVPAFIAAAYTMNYYKEHNLSVKKSSMPILCDTVLLDERVHLEQISQVMQIPVSDIKSLNPQYRLDIVQAKDKPYVLRLPFDKITQFIDLQDSIIGYKDSIYFNPKILTKAPEYTKYTPSAPTKNHTKLYYTVKSGDNLGFIAAWYGVGVSKLRYWNNIRRNMIRAGQKLVVYVPKNKVSKYQKINGMTFAQKQSSIGKSVGNSVVSSEPDEKLNTGEYELYTVRRGDSLWSIAKKYGNVSEDDIMRWNGISNANKISVGQKLKIKTNS